MASSVGSDPDLPPPDLPCRASSGGSAGEALQALTGTSCRQDWEESRPWLHLGATPTEEVKVWFLFFQGRDVRRTSQALTASRKPCLALRAGRTGRDAPGLGSLQGRILFSFFLRVARRCPIAKKDKKCKKCKKCKKRQKTSKKRPFYYSVLFGEAGGPLRSVFAGFLRD